MNKETLLAILARHDMRIDESRGGAGNFRDLYIGTGQSFESLRAVKSDLESAGLKMVKLDFVTVQEHPDCGKPFLCVGSFWWE